MATAELAAWEAAQDGPIPVVLLADLRRSTGLTPQELRTVALFSEIPLLVPGGHRGRHCVLQADVDRLRAAAADYRAREELLIYRPTARVRFQGPGSAA